MLEAIVHRAERGFDLQCAQDAHDVAAARIAAAQGVGIFIDIVAEGPGIERILGVGSRNLDKDLVFQSDVPKGQFAVEARPRQEFDDVLLIAQPGPEKNEHKRADGQNGIQPPLVLLEISVNR